MLRQINCVLKMYTDIKKLIKIINYIKVKRKYFT